MHISVVTFLHVHTSDIEFLTVLACMTILNIIMMIVIISITLNEWWAE